tara:strand:- start:16 stop:435 length:420 start_codon:yes stop_codon:yes gene_type:complete
VQLYVHFKEHQYQDSYIDEYVGDYVNTTYVRLELLKVSDECNDYDNCHPVDLIHQAVPCEIVPSGMDSVYVVVCRFNNIAASIFEDWNILGMYTSEEEANEVSVSFEEDPRGFSELSSSLIILYCQTYEIPLHLLESEI